MTNASLHRIASSRRRFNGLARWATVVLPLACGSVALGDDGLVAVSGVFGLASSLSAMSDEEIQAIDARSQSEAIAAQSAMLASQSQVIPKPLWVRGGQPQAVASSSDEGSTPVAPVFRPARHRTAAEMRAATESVRVTPPAQQAPVRPSVKAPARIDGPQPEVTRPVTGDRPPMPFSRLLSQVQY